MSLFGSLLTGVSGLGAQGRVLGVLGDNIANSSTVGFKAADVTFASLVAGDSGSVANRVGTGARTNTRTEVASQGLIQTTGISTDVAISGQGMFVVKDSVEIDEGEFFYTRAGSFRQDNRGNFVNSSGFALMAWPLDNNGNIPGEQGNINTTSAQLLESLAVVNTRDLSGIAVATTDIAFGINLDASELPVPGAGDTAQPISVANKNILSSDILATNAGQIESGDILKVTLGSGETINFEYGGLAESDQITTNNIFGASTPGEKFQISANAAPEQLQDGDNFTISTPTIGTVTFKFQDINPNPLIGSFNSLNTLATAIDNIPGMVARVADNKLFMSPVDATEEMTLTDVTGNIVASLGHVSGNFNSTQTATTNRFSSLDGLATLVDKEPNLSAVVEGDAVNSSVTIRVNNPLETITFADGGGAGGNLLTEFGLAATTFDPVYDVDAITGSNMASGDIPPAFTRNVRIFDSLGKGHDLRISFAKAQTNDWLVEVYAANPEEVSTALPNGILASGNVTFNGDGSLRDVSPGLLNLNAVWTNGAVPSPIELDLGTAGLPEGTPGAIEIGLTDGLSQFSGNYNVQFADQNGAGSGLLSSIEISGDGFVIANFTNGQSRKVYQIPIASFPNMNGLTPQGNNVFSQSDVSGEFSLQEVGSAGVGSVVVEALESSNADLANQLTDLIVAQRIYSANTKSIETASQLLEELVNLQ